MLIIRKIIHCKNSLKRKLLLSFEAVNLCKLMIVKEFDYLHTQNIKTCEHHTFTDKIAQIIIASPFDQKKLLRCAFAYKKRNTFLVPKTNGLLIESLIFNNKQLFLSKNTNVPVVVFI